VFAPRRRRIHRARLGLRRWAAGQRTRHPRDPAAVITLDRPGAGEPAKPDDDPAAQADGLCLGAAGARLYAGGDADSAERQCRTPDTPVFHPSCLKGLAPAGRLDIDSTGLLVLTQDGRVARQLIGRELDDRQGISGTRRRPSRRRGLALLNHGLSLDDRKLKPAKVEWLNDDQLRFVLREGESGRSGACASWSGCA
jgi:hypothetical protein